MTIARMRSILSVLWVSASLPILIVLVIQSLTEKFGDDWDIPWGWFLLLYMPFISIIVGAWSVNSNLKHSRTVGQPHLVYGGIAISATYIICLYITLFAAPFLGYEATTILRKSTWYMGFFEQIVLVVVAKIFVDEIN